MRSAGIVPRSPTIWHVDVTQSGTFCLADAGSVMLWRPDASAPATLTIDRPGRRLRATSTGRPGSRPSPGRADAPIASGGAYSLARRGVAVPTQDHLPDAQFQQPTDLQAVAAALIANGCQEQLDVLVETAARPDRG